MKTILIVDDSMLARTVIRRAVHACDVSYQVVEAKDGVEALQRLRDLPAVDLLITDLNMPRMGGEELLERLRTEERKPEQTMVISSTVSTVRKLRLLRLGVEHVLAKPYQPEMLQQQLAPLLDAPHACALDEESRSLLDAAMLDTLSQLVFRVAVPVNAGQLFDPSSLLGTVSMSGAARGTLSIVAEASWCEHVSRELTGGDNVGPDFVGELANIVGGGIVASVESRTGTDVALSAPVVRAVTDPVTADRGYQLEDGSRIGVVWNLTLPQAIGV